MERVPIFRVGSVREFVLTFLQLKRPLNSVRPDAIIHRKNDIFEWMEVTSVWQGEHKKKHKLFAKALNSHVSHGEVFHHHFENGYWKTLEMTWFILSEKKILT